MAFGVEKYIVFKLQTGAFEVGPGNSARPASDHPIPAVKR